MNPAERLRQAILGTADPHTLLISAWTAALQARAGWIPSQSDDPLDPPFPLDDDRPMFDLSIVRLLLSEKVPDYRRANPEAFEAAFRIGRKFPAEYTPAFLNLAADDVLLRPWILPLLDRRSQGLRLANLHEWGWAVDKLPLNYRELWSIGADEWFQGDVFRLLRQQDPAAARLWLSEMTIDEARTAILYMDVNLTQDDEPILEDLLGQGLHVIDLLRRLPNSRYCQRMIARVRPLILLVDQQIIFECPTEFDVGMERDQLRRHISSSLIFYSDRHWWLYELVEHTPIRFWLEHFQAEIDQVIAAMATTPPGLNLLSSLLQACYYSADREFARALIRLYPKEMLMYSSNLLSLFSAEEYELIVIDHITHYLDGTGNDPFGLLIHGEATWSCTLSKLAVEVLQWEIGGENNFQRRYDLNTILWVYGLHLQPTYLDRLLALFHPLETDVEQPDWLYGLIRFRRLILTRINAQAGL